MLLLGIDLGTSSIKVSVVNAETQECLAAASYPETEADIISPFTGWAEQSPDQWWENVKQAILKCHSSNQYDPTDIAAIGIAYQMHGLVLVDKQQARVAEGLQTADFVGLPVENRYVFGYGLDYQEYLRNARGIFAVQKEFE